MSKKQRLTPVEHIKEESRYLRGTIVESLNNQVTGSVAPEDTHLLKFHGTYQQDDRDLRNEREKQKLEPAFEFMIRVRVPGGIATPEQWLEMDRLAHQYANGSLRLTTRQAFQFHGILKWNLKQTIKEINESLLDTIAACGDVNRNVMCSPNYDQSDIHQEVYEWSKKISEHLTPQTTAYHEIWLDKEKVADSRDDEEPIYGKSYLPRKFKISMAIPPANDVDVFAQDLGYIAIVADEKLQGFNITVGGGMGMTHGDTATYPNLGCVIGFCKPEQAVEVAEQVVKVQRDFGDRTNRKHARLKYTINDRGVAWFKAELHERLGYELEEKRPYKFEYAGDRYGWTQNSNGAWNLTLFIQNGRIRDYKGYLLMTGLREIAKIHDGDFRLTGNQNVMVGSVSSENKAKVEAIVKEYNLTDGKHTSALRRNSIACVALPTCGLAMAEAERYLPELLDKIEIILDDVGLANEDIIIRMTGCPNGCGRPYLGEIGFVGKAPGKYNMYLGAGFAGERLNKLYKENIGEAEILESLKPLLHQYASEREDGERFGMFAIRKGYVKYVNNGLDFHA